jgi:glycosyltransferase involved in cell wall biosynthesis
MSESLAHLGHDMHIVTYHFGLPIPTRQINIHRIPTFAYRRFEPGPSLTKLCLLDPLLVYKLFQVVRKYAIELIHAHHFEGALAGLAVRLLTGVKVVYDAHTTLEGEMHLYHFIQLEPLKRLLDKNIPQWANHVVAVSDTIRIFLEARGISRSKIDVVPTGVYPDEFENDRAGEIRKRHGLGNCPVVMYTGSMAAFQGVDHLIPTMASVVRRHPEARLLLVGDFEAPEFVQRGRAYGLNAHIHIVKKSTFEEIPHYLSAADVVVSPRTECPGIPQKLVNYMAARKAIVAFEGSAKLLRHEHNGLVVANGDTAAMANAVSALIEAPHKRRQLGRNACDTIIGNYDWPTLSRRLEQKYFQILACAP